MKKQTKNVQHKFRKKHGLEKLGLMSNKRWIEDPRGLLFSLSRYKFVSKMLEGKKFDWRHVTDRLKPLQW